MTTNDVFKRALRLCGMDEEYLSDTEIKDVRARAADIMSAALFDLGYTEPEVAVTDRETVSDGMADAAVYGVAMLLSLGFGDTDKAKLFSDIYSQKRSAVKSEVLRITDVLPGTGAV